MEIIEKILNNNVLLVKSEKGEESIFVGNGIGFHAVVGNTFNQMEKVSQVFVFKEKANLKSYHQLQENINNNLLAVIEEEIALIQDNLGTLNENIHVSLPDHISFAIERYYAGLDFITPFNNDIKVLYTKEYKLAEQLIHKVNSLFNIELNEDEIGIVAIHINAARNNEAIETSRKRQMIIQEIVVSIYKAFNLKPDFESLLYQRFLIHVRFAIDRILSHREIKSDIEDVIKTKYKEIYLKIQTIIRNISKEYVIDIPDAEICYLVMHFVQILHE